MWLLDIPQVESWRYENYYEKKNKKLFCFYFSAVQDIGAAADSCVDFVNLSEASFSEGKRKLLLPDSAIWLFDYL